MRPGSQGVGHGRAAKRKSFANDIGYKASLIAVTTHSNGSKGDREPQERMAERGPGFACKYLKRWSAVGGDGGCG